MPKLNLTNNTVKRLKLPLTDKSSIDYWDSTLRRLGLRISPIGRRTFNMQVKLLHNGRRRDTRIKLGVYHKISLAEARILAIEHKRLAAEGQRPVVLLPAERNAQDKNGPIYRKRYSTRCGNFSFKLTFTLSGPKLPLSIDAH